MQNFVEELIADFFQAKGYFVTKNYWIPFNTKRERTQRGQKQKYESQSWTDIDVLARNDKELVIIQVKAIINDKKLVDKIIKFFKRVDDYLKKEVAPDGKSSIKWWRGNVKVRKLVIYEWENSPKSYIQQIKKKGIEVEPFRKYFDELIDYINNKKGVKEENAALRLLHFLKQQGFLRNNNGG
jgi:hypothetical protein